MPKSKSINGRVNALVINWDSLPKNGRRKATSAPPLIRGKARSAAKPKVRSPGRSGSRGRRSETGLATHALRQRKRAPAIPKLVFRPDGDGWWQVGFADELKRYRDTFGLRQIYLLLLQRGELIPLLDLNVRGLGTSQAYYQLVSREQLTDVRKSVRSTVEYALKRIVGQDPIFGAHLRDCIKLDFWCGYFPNIHVNWVL